MSSPLAGDLESFRTQTVDHGASVPSPTRNPTRPAHASDAGSVLPSPGEHSIFHAHTLGSSDLASMDNRNLAEEEEIQFDLLNLGAQNQHGARGGVDGAQGKLGGLHPTATPNQGDANRTCANTVDPYHERSYVESAQALPNKSRRSFADVVHAVRDIRTFHARLGARRQSMSTSSMQPTEDWTYDGSQSSMTPLTPRRKTPKPLSRICSWLRNASTTFHRKPLSPTYDASSTFEESFPPRSIPETIPEPSVFPEHRSSGAAARAAAAQHNAQNEMSEINSQLMMKESTMTRDSESGIGIDLKDQSEVTAEVEIPVKRQGQPEINAQE